MALRYCFHSTFGNETVMELSRTRSERASIFQDSLQLSDNSWIRASKDDVVQFSSIGAIPTVCKQEGEPISLCRPSKAAFKVRTFSCFYPFAGFSVHIRSVPTLAPGNIFDCLTLITGCEEMLYESFISYRGFLALGEKF